jgi:hypothetical protein
VVGADKIDNNSGRLALRAISMPLAYVADNDLGAFFVRQLIVRVKARALVLDKKQGFSILPIS